VVEEEVDTVSVVEDDIAEDPEDVADVEGVFVEDLEVVFELGLVVGDRVPGSGGVEKDTGVSIGDREGVVAEEAALHLEDVVGMEFLKLN
jgi:hypothetical protein